MFISYNWLQKLTTDLTETPDEIAETLSLSLAEVEEVREVDDDHVLEIENKALSHRPDLFSQLGIAREVAAALDKTTIPPHKEAMKKQYLHTAVVEPNREVTLDIEDETLCPRYMAVVIDNLKVGESPDWMQKRLKSLGQKPINNIVDITNCVMHELGQPIHAFDAGKLETRNSKFEIGVRKAKKEETVTTIDKTERKLNGGEPVITSTIQTSNHSAISDQPVALAGIMGGAETQVSDKTTTILLESANFNMYRVRKTSKALGLRTDASLRFEKGLDPNLAEEGLRRCVELFKEIGGGEVVSEVADFYPTPVEPLEIEINLERVRNFLGVELSDEDILNYWERLHLNTSSTSYLVTVPTFRRDLNLPEDLYEEAARLHGYNNFKPTFPARPIVPPLENKEWRFANRIRDVLVGLGMDEILTYSFTNPEEALQKENQPDGLNFAPLKLANPIAPEMSYLRTSLLPSLGEKVVENAKRFNEFGLFEIGKVTRTNPKLEIRNSKQTPNSKSEIRNKDKEGTFDNLPNEPNMLAAAYYAKDKDEEQVYLHTKGILETLLTTLNINPLAYNTQPETLNPKGSKSLTGAAYSFGIELATLQELSEPKRFADIPPHMPTYQDLSFIVDEDVAVGEILKIIHDVPAAARQQRARPPLRSVKLTDIYQSNQLRAQHQKSLTLRLEFLDPAGPLSDRKVTPYRQEIEEKLKEKFNAKIR